MLNPDGAVLSPSQVKRLLAAQARRVGAFTSVSGCFWPHHAFVFRDVRGRAVASIEVCFDCHKALFRPEDKRSNPKLWVFAEVFRELKLPFGDATSKELRDHGRKFRAWERAERKANRRLPAGTPEIIKDVPF